jgi:hypothetical protein
MCAALRCAPIKAAASSTSVLRNAAGVVTAAVSCGIVDRFHSRVSIHSIIIRISSGIGSGSIRGKCLEQEDLSIVRSQAAAGRVRDAEE